MSSATAVTPLPTEPTTFLENATCAVCGSSSYTIERASAYPPQISREQLLQIYSSSSDHKLMDQMVRCKECDFVYLNPRVARDIAMTSYSDAVDPTFAAQNPFRIRTFRRVLQGICKRLRLSANKNFSVLDVGCAGGAFVKAAAEEGFTAVGVEPSRWLVEFGKREYGLDLRAGVVEDQGFPNQSFNMVTLWDVLEHLYNPHEVLADCRRVLNKDGYLIVNYPDYGSFMARILGSLWPFLLNVHLFYFTPKTITNLLERNGFSVVSVTPFFQTLEFGYVLKRAGAYIPGLNVLSKLTYAVGLGKLPLTYNMGQSMVIAKIKA